jgi:bifunctional DNA-binding transcriptional regulator/antitoxin component of YhaV-PrlF toxin-antitoxin module
MISLTNQTEVGQVGRSEHQSSVEVPLRQKNQITLPAEVARALEASPGDRLLFTVYPDAPDTAVVRRIRESYYGALAGAYGSTHDELLDYVRTEHASWSE